jgi:uncharacterized protein YdaU (DUF1376 family)
VLPWDGEEIPYLAIFPTDIDRWQNSRAYRRMSLAAQGAYTNLWYSAWKAQPACVLPDDDRELWRLANAKSIEDWQALKAEVFSDTDAWAYTPAGWLNEVVLEVYQESARRHAAAVRSGRIAGKASARVRRAHRQAAALNKDGTAVQRPFNDRSTTVYPPSPSPSLSPSQSPSQSQAEQAGLGESAAAPSDPPPPAAGASGITYDPEDPVQVQLVVRCYDLATKEAAAEGREATAQDVLETLRAVSCTPGGKTLHDGDIRTAPHAWIEQTLRACDDFERDLPEPEEEPEEPERPPPDAAA